MYIIHGSEPETVDTIVHNRPIKVSGLKSAPFFGVLYNSMDIEEFLLSRRENVIYYISTLKR